MKDPWDAFINRAKELATKNLETAELLTFYSKLLAVQKRVYHKLGGRRGWLPSGMLARDLIVIEEMMPLLLEVVEVNGPAPLVEESRVLAGASRDEIGEMLMQYWIAPTDLQFFAKALLQPYARRLAEIGARPVDRNLVPGENRCPFCAGKPQVAVLDSHNSDSDAGSRNLLCSTCLSAWPFRRVVCANCGEQEPAKLGYFHTDKFEHVRAEFCDACKHYLKSIDLTKMGLAVPLVDEVAAAPLDLWAHERDYVKIELNLVGL
jgi:formate dehydrogenase accessory protein FdhE